MDQVILENTIAETFHAEATFWKLSLAFNYNQTDLRTWRNNNNNNNYHFILNPVRDRVRNCNYKFENSNNVHLTSERYLTSKFTIFIIILFLLFLNLTQHCAERIDIRLVVYFKIKIICIS